MDALLPFTSELLCEPLLVLRDSLQLSGSFMLPILTKLALQAGRAVVLVAVTQGAAHYQQALRKVGVNMATHMQSGQLAVVDALTDVELLSEAELHAGAPELISRILAAIGRAQQQPLAAAVGADSGTAAGTAAQPAAGSSTNGLHAFSDTGSYPTRWSDGEPEQQLQPAVCVLVDDLTSIGSLAADDTRWRALLKQLLAVVMAERQSDHLSIGSGSRRSDGSAMHGLSSGSVSLCALLHADVEDAAAAELLTSHAANVLVDIEPLTAGQSADVSGRMNMQLQDCTADVPWGTSETDCQRRFFVKVSDRGVRFLQQYTAA